MSRIVVSSIAFLSVIASVGCSATGSRVQAADLDARLARLERERLAAASPARARQLAGPTGGVARGVAASPATANGRASVGATDADYALADLTAESGASGAETPAADREALYARRPPLPGFGQTVKRDVKHMHLDLWRDTKRVYGNPLNLAILGVTYGGALALQETGPDGTVEDYYRREDKTYSRDWADTFGALGNPGTHFALAGVLYLAGQQAQDDKTYEVGKTLFSALIINGVSTMVGQTASFDRAPNGEWGTFPSGHTSSTFVVASVLHEAYGPVAGVPLYSLGVLVGVERLNSGEHYLSDVVFGAVMGTVIGHSVASGRDPELFGWKVLPYADPVNGASGVALMKSFK